MRNLKRVLSLGLSTAMLLGMMVVGSSAADYEDVSSANHQEAIEVLQAVGVMIGDEDGNFNPDQQVTRNEMAVVMSNLMDYNVATYSGTSPFTDVPSWAEPYVAACWTNKITAGYTDTTYGGSDTVTTSQAALMLMKALGYFQYGSDFGSDWQLATVVQGNKIALFKDVDAGVRDALTRNELAQLVLNTLKSGTVEPDDSTITVTTPDGTQVDAGKVDYVYVSSTENYAKAIKDDQAYSNTSISTVGWIVELGEKLYDGDLRLSEADDGTRDSFGRPANEWKLKTNEIGLYPETPLASYTAKVSKGTLWSLLGRTNVNNLGSETTLDVYANGVDVTMPKANYFASNSSAAAGTDTVNDVAANGVLTEVYMNDDGDVTIVYINTYLAQANGDYNENTGLLNTVTLTNPGTYTLGTLSVEDFEDLASFQDEDYILYTVSYDGGTASVETIAKAEVVTGNVDAYSHTESVTIGGTKYDYAKRIEGTDTTGSKATEFTVGATAAVVIDQYGYVIYVDDASLSVGNYLYVDGVIKATGFGDNYSARVYFSDGTKSTVDIDKLYERAGDGTLNSTKTDLSTAVMAPGTHTWDGWYAYSETDGEYTLREAATNNSAPFNGAAAEVKVVKNSTVKFLDGKSVRGDEDTVFVVVDTDGDVTVYVGINNAPDISINAGATTTTLDVDWMLKKDTTGNYASLVYVNADGKTGVTISGGNADTLMYVLNRDTTYIDRPTGETIETWNVILDGQQTKVDAKKGELSSWTMYYKVQESSDGYVKATVFPGITGDYTENSLSKLSDEIKYSAGTISLGGYTYSVNSDTEIILVLQDATGPNGGTKVDYPTNLLGHRDALGNVIVMTDPDAKYEVQTGLTGRGLENALRGYTVDAKFYGVADDDLLQSIYVVVTDVAVAP